MMTKLISLLIMLLLCFQVEAQQSFVMKGTIKGVPDNTEISLHFDNPRNEPLVKGMVQKGRFELKGVVPEPALYVLMVPVAKQPLGIFLDGSTMEVDAVVDSLHKGTVTGSPLNNEFNNFRQTFDPYFLKLDQLSKLFGDARYQSKQDSLFGLARIIISELDVRADKYISDNSNSAVTPLLLYMLYSFFQQADVLDARFSKLSTAAQTSYYGRMVNEQVQQNKIGSVGSQAIDFSQADTSGNKVSLSSFKGKYVLVDFWASWCGPCRVENPTVVAAYNRYKDKNFTVLGVSLDRAREPWLQAIQQDGLTWTQVSDLKFWSNEVAQLYRITSIPQNFLIDPEGVIIAKNLRGEELLAKLEEILNQKQQ